MIKDDSGIDTGVHMIYEVGGQNWEPGTGVGFKDQRAACACSGRNDESCRARGKSAQSV